MCLRNGERNEDTLGILSLNPSQHLPSFSKILPLGYLPLHVCDMQKNEAVNEDNQNMLTSCFLKKVSQSS